jgi:hypothetical protein
MRTAIHVFAVFGMIFVAMCALGMIAFAPPMALHSLIMSSCAGSPIMEVPSTDAWVAVVDNDNCTENGESRTIVWLRERNGASTSIFAAPLVSRNAGTYSSMGLQLTWVGPAELELAYPLGSKAESMLDHVGAVKIIYKPVVTKPQT